MRLIYLITLSLLLVSVIRVQAYSLDPNLNQVFINSCPVTKFNRQLMTGQIKGLIIPHHQLSQGVWDQALVQLAKQKPSVIYLLSPNHADRGPMILTTDRWIKSKSSSQLYQSTYQSWRKISNVYEDEVSVMQDQGVTMPMISINKYLPTVPVIPILFRKQTPWASLTAISDFLARQDERAVIIASLDFSHDLDVKASQIADQKTINLIRSNNWREIMYLDSSYVDGPTALTSLGLTMDKLKTKIDLVWRGHAGQFLNDCFGPTTTYQIWTFSK